MLASGRRLLKLVFIIFAGLIIAGCDINVAQTTSRSTVAEKLNQVPRTVASWDKNWGNHRAVISVDRDVPAVWIHIPWRRCDNDPQKKAVVIRFAANDKKIENVFVNTVNNEYGDIIFEPKFGRGEYHIYYMPIAEDSKWLSQTKYIHPKQTASAQWIKKQQLDAGHLSSEKLAKFPKAKLLAIQAVSQWDSFSPMEIIATAAEVNNLVSKYPRKNYLVFPQDRTSPIKMKHYLPLEFIQKAPADHFTGDALRNEFYAFQLGIYAAKDAVNDVKVEFAPLKANGNDNIIPASAMQCFNLGGVDWLGQKFTKTYSLEKGLVGALWLGIQIPPDAKPGLYNGLVTIIPANQEPTPISLKINVDDKLLADCGDSEPWRLSRLRWLNSTIALNDLPAKDFLPLTVSDKTISCLGRKVTLGDNGLPVSIQSYFSAGVTKILDTSRQILARPIRFAVVDSNDKALTWTITEPVNFTKKSDGKVAWRSQSRCGNVTVQLQAAMEFDGFIDYKLTLSATEPLDVKDVYLDVHQPADVARYMLGMGYKGAALPQKHDWKWDVKRKRDSVWIGDVSAGLRCQLKGENYSRPFVNVHYNYKPLMMPPSWFNDGRGGAVVNRTDINTVVLHAYSGQRTIQPDKPLHFDFSLLITPFKTINTNAQWAQRYFQKGDSATVTDPCDVRNAGANIINIHHGNDCNPYINYPFLTVDKLKQYISKAHDNDLRVKIYYTVRELSNHTAEFWALRSLGDEILVYGNDRPGNSWLQEHLVDDYLSAWYQKTTADASVLTAGMSRWHNYYLQGLDWLAKNIEIDGLYLDGIAYDRDVMKRVRKILENDRPAPLIDLHEGDNYKWASSGMESSANMYMEHLPYVDRLWFGEGYDYDQLPPDFWLIELSGIPFGVMSEMLNKGGNPWCGMVYGMTNRLSWGGDPTALWKFWDDFGIHDSEMFGYWDPNCPVSTDNDLVKATAYRKKDKILIAVANWADTKVDVHLKLKQGVFANPENAVLTARPIKNYQPQTSFKLTGAIPVESRKGWLLILEETNKN